MEVLALEHRCLHDCDELRDTRYGGRKWTSSDV